MSCACNDLKPPPLYMRNPHTQQRKKNTLIFPNTKKKPSQYKIKIWKILYCTPIRNKFFTLFFCICTRTFMIVFDHHHHHLVAHLSEGVCTRAYASHLRADTNTIKEMRWQTEFVFIECYIHKMVRIFICHHKTVCVCVCGYKKWLKTVFIYMHICLRSSSRIIDREKKRQHVQ